MENQIKLNGENSNSFTKHATIRDNYELNINTEYSSSFDKIVVLLNITKPILGEPFIFIVIIHKLSLEDKIVYDLTFVSDITELGDYIKTFTSFSSDHIIHYI